MASVLAPRGARVKAPQAWLAGAAGEIIGAAVTDKPALHNLIAAAGAIYMLHLCLWA